jgi:hypothetical protein
VSLGFPLADGIFHLIADIAEFLGGNVFQAFAATVEVLVDFQGRFLHDGMRIPAAAPEKEVFPLRHAGLLIVLIEAQSQQGGRFFGFVRCFHDCYSTKPAGDRSMENALPGRGFGSSGLQKCLR